MHRRSFIAGSFTALGVLAIVPAKSALAAEEVAPRKQWICPPCGCADDDKVFSAPGRCPDCDEELIEKPPAPAEKAPPR